MSLLATINSEVKFQPHATGYLVTHKTSDMEQPFDTSWINSEEEAQDAVNHAAAASNVQYVVLKIMWEVDVNRNRVLKEYVASVKNGGLANGTINWANAKENPPKRLAPTDFSKKAAEANPSPTNTPFDF